ncbi:rhodanese-like domain-containing protein [Cognatishimia maritima]|uniref:Rhodanese-related sulfurtransferase n=1 Tax=Cognatishimia maritima TaxID=870908 RepID=A0A1M5K7Z9_9RHOB|nr:rhodanese-like domain-containing protein [Cognatishimia maritima]SHG48700.1 Rhodanese-related sulfurtransferase [Cognatishimia maritima]
MKRMKDFLDEANEVVPKATPEEGIAIHAKGDAVFIDVRDSNSLRDSGTIAGALHIPRGMVELSADPDTPFHKPELQKDAHLCLVCGGGVMAAMAGKTLKEMGYTNVTNVGGINAWKEAGGPTEDVE